ncbi:ParA family protein [Halobaculum lipolyticum]|uniref:ParA family protein n=1 Tax=Halobaculum lipolyticum TaxID=3032001 RepID=A0ABD5W6D9_9EURY|nr:ParA family protein [Halobaculum sp. DT31]
MSLDPEGYPGAVVSLFKGGVTKTSTSLNVAHQLSERDSEVAVVDLDKDGHLTSLLGYERQLDNGDDIGDAVFGDTDPGDLLVETDFGLHLLPATESLETVEGRMKDRSFGVKLIRTEVVEPLVAGDIDYVLIDPPGGRGMLHDAALVAVQRVIVPLIPSAGSVSGLENLLRRSLVPLRKEVPLDIVAITPNMMRESIAQESGEQMLARELNTNEEFGETAMDLTYDGFDHYLPEYARVDPEFFAVVADDDRSVAATYPEIPKPGIRYRKAINDATRHGLPLAEWEPTNDQIAAFDALADRVERASPDPERERAEAADA